MDRNIFGIIEDERRRQDRKWGEQNHQPEKWICILMEEVGEAAKAVLEAFPHTIQIEDREYWLQRYRKELIEVAAVAVAAVESLHRNEWLKERP